MSVFSSYQKKIIILFFCSFHCPSFASASFVCLVGWFWTLSPVGKLCPRAWRSSADHSHSEAGPKTRGKLCGCGGGLPAAGAHCERSGGTPAFSPGSSLPRGCLVFPEEPPSLLPAGSERKSDGSRGCHRSFVH